MAYFRPAAPESSVIFLEVFIWCCFFFSCRNIARRFCNVYLITVCSSIHWNKILVYIRGRSMNCSLEILKKLSEYLMKEVIWISNGESHQIDIEEKNVRTKLTLSHHILQWMLCYWICGESPPGNQSSMLTGKELPVMWGDSEELTNLDHSGNLQTLFSPIFFERFLVFPHFLGHFSCLLFSCFYLSNNRLLAFLLWTESNLNNISTVISYPWHNFPFCETSNNCNVVYCFLGSLNTVRRGKPISH